MIYKFLVKMPSGSGLPADDVVNSLHFQNVASGGLLQTDLDSMADSIIDVFQTGYGDTTGKVSCSVYEVGPKPQYPKAQRSKGNQIWTHRGPPELAICLSFAKNKSIPSQRGRIYLAPTLWGTFTAGTHATLRPGTAVQNFALGFYKTANKSFPDCGGIDWKFGVWSPTQQTFHQTQEAWVDNEWDHMRSRGLRPDARVTSVREG